MPLIGYLRVSTGRQQVSGLGLEAQRSSIEQYASQIGETIEQVFVETESGSKKNRPELAAALVACKKQKATLIIAKLDRLARNVAFVSSLMEAGVEFIAVDAPYANKLMLHILSAFAEHEREMISERTKAALAAAKARGVKLGRNGAVLAAQNKAAADKHAELVQKHIMGALDEGCVTYQAIAKHLTSEGVKTADSGRWHPATVRLIMKRLNIEK
ncbi:recombinase family protein [Parasphingorhabdus sp. DH2-15]|uniref:recombinase family protein n=1 Tax=Parasphingorhabdus sp. DH2-15 TaxID=3444112 RepID=UPI003F685D17